MLVAAILLAYWALRAYGRGLKKQGEPHKPAVEEDMVCCAQCGVHLPKSESITSQGKFFCSDEHRRQHLS